MAATENTSKFIHDMKKNFAVLVALALCPAVFLSSCVYEYPTYGGGYYGAGYNSGYDEWTEASYDADGFPIYGYSYGRPVYGYTAAGAAIFTIAAITAACTVPYWAPASWYHGHYHYPHGVHHHHCPPHYPHGHFPHKRPIGGLNAPIHKNPYKVMEANMKAQRKMINAASERQAKINVAAANMAAKQREATQRAAAANLRAQQNNIKMVADRQAQMNKAALRQAAAQQKAMQNAAQQNMRAQQNALKAQQNMMKAQQSAVRAQQNAMQQNALRAQQNMMRAQQNAVRAQQSALRDAAAQRAAAAQRMQGAFGARAHKR